MSPRTVALIALLCQLAATTLPVVHASTAGSAPAPREHCAHQQPDVLRSVPPTGARHGDHAGHARYCCDGQCTCAQAVALLCMLPDSPCTAAVPATLGYRVPDMPQPDTVFFRPPI